MSRRGALVALVLLLGATLAVALAVAVRAPAESSSLSRAPLGWLGARAWLEAQGTEVDLRRTSWSTEPLDAVLVVGFGVQRLVAPAEVDALRLFVHGGGTLVLGFGSSVHDPSQGAVLDALRMPARPVGERPPLDPQAWRAWARREWTLRPERDAWRDGRPLRLSPVRAVPSAPRDAAVLFREPGGTPIVFVAPFGRGRVIVLPAEAISNRRLASAGNADLLESLRRTLGTRWSFDEYHHGLGPTRAGEASAGGATFDAFLAQLALVYLAGLWALARRFGPAWSEPPVQAGSTAAFLRGVGRRHHRLGHHRTAARLLVERARALQPWVEAAAPADVDAKALVALARAVARQQSGGRRA